VTFFWHGNQHMYVQCMIYRLWHFSDMEMNTFMYNVWYTIWHLYHMEINTCMYNVWYTVCDIFLTWKSTHLCTMYDIPCDISLTWKSTHLCTMYDIPSDICLTWVKKVRGKKYGEKSKGKGQLTSDDVTSGQSCARYHFWLFPIAPPPILLCQSPYTTPVCGTSNW
jgi:hypothetical protein